MIDDDIIVVRRQRRVRRNPVLVVAIAEMMAGPSIDYVDVAEKRPRGARGKGKTRKQWELSR